jgi:argininosuccinate lyase
MNHKDEESSNKTDKTSNSMWGGRFDSGPDAIMEAINVSVGFDRRLFSQDIAGSKAHCSMLRDCGILDQDASEEILAGLDKINSEIVAGTFEFKNSLEDIHLNIESRLGELIGDNAGRLHTARSRNDQVATDFRLWLRDGIDQTLVSLRELHVSLIDQADRHFDWVMPGFTHLQVAQPVTLGHHLLAFVEMFGRDKGRFSDCRKRLNESPLGAAALAGTSFPINRYFTSETLGFDGPAANSLDAVSARDFAVEFMSAAAICATHLSRLAEEIVLWSSSQFGFALLSDAFTTGSSIMPQKRNPDAAELIRAKTGRIYGDLVTLLTVMKGLPLAYSKDMQEDKEPVFDASDSILLMIKAMAAMVKDLTFDRDKMQLAASEGYSTATDLADWLVRELDMPFRRAHRVTGEIVRVAEKSGRRLSELDIESLREIEPLLTNAVFDVLSVENSVASRTSFGGTAPNNVREQVAKARTRFLL